MSNTRGDERPAARRSLPGPRRAAGSRSGSHMGACHVKTILLAEDDPHIRRVSEIALRRDGFEVTSVGDGTEALQLLEDRLFDLVLLDGMMPKLDGLEVCRRIKENPRTAAVPVIMLSARTQPLDEAAGRAAGAIGYIRKPFDALTLGRQVRDICGDDR
jgi:two-component system phosphate regulon response regulator PhoB